MGVFVAPRGNKEADFINYIESDAIFMPEVTGIRALDNSDIFTGVNILGGDLGQSSFRPVPNESHDKELLHLLNKRPNKKQSHYMFMYATVASLILYGNSYALLHREGNRQDGKIETIEFVTPRQVNVQQDMTTGEWTYDVTMDYGNIIYTCRPEDILHFRISTVDGFLGRSPLLSLKDEVAMQTNGNKILSKFFANGVFGGGILKLKGGVVDNKTKQKIRVDFEKANGGTTNSNGVLVLDESQEFQEYKMNTDILKLIQSNKFSTQQIAKVLGIPLNRFGMELVNSTDSGQNQIYIGSTLSSYESAICDEIEIKTGSTLEFDFSSLMNDTTDDRRRALFGGKNSNKEMLSALTVDEVREYFGYTAEGNTDKIQVNTKGAESNGTNGSTATGNSTE